MFYRTVVRSMVPTLVVIPPILGVRQGCQASDMVQLHVLLYVSLKQQIWPTNFFGMKFSGIFLVDMFMSARDVTVRAVRAKIWPGGCEPRADLVCFRSDCIQHCMCVSNSRSEPRNLSAWNFHKFFGRSVYIGPRADGRRGSRRESSARPPDFWVPDSRRSPRCLSLDMIQCMEWKNFFFWHFVLIILNQWDEISVFVTFSWR